MSMLDPFDGTHRVDHADSLPRHTQVQNIVRTLVVNGRLRPGDKLPAEVDIASVLGVSKMTVNKALLALQADGLLVREIGRGTFVAHRSTTKARVMPRIVLTFPRGERDVLGNDYYSPLHQGISDFFGAETPAPKAALVLSPLNATDYLAEDDQNPAEGRIIIAPRQEYVSSVNALWNRGRAVVVIGASWPQMDYPCVDSDNVSGAMQAVQHLVQLGHRRIALLYAQASMANTLDRITGYRRALSAAGITHDAALELEAAEAWKAGETAATTLRGLMRGAEPVTAVFAAGYYLALETLHILHEQRLQVPEDVSVIGYDDPMGAQLTYPPLTTMRQPLFEMGSKASERLSVLLNQASRSPTHDVLVPSLVVRRSTAARKK